MKFRPHAECLEWRYGLHWNDLPRKGNHTWTHPKMWLFSGSGISQEGRLASETCPESVVSEAKIKHSCHTTDSKLGFLASALN